VVRLILLRLAPLVMLVVAAGFWFNEVQDSGPYVLRNLVPLLVLVLLAMLTLYRGQGNWNGSGWRLPLGVAGYAIPAL
jgi:hypothetical protein